MYRRFFLPQRWRCAALISDTNQNSYAIEKTSEAHMPNDETNKYPQKWRKNTGEHTKKVQLNGKNGTKRRSGLETRSVESPEERRRGENKCIYIFPFVSVLRMLHGAMLIVFIYVLLHLFRFAIMFRNGGRSRLALKLKHTRITSKYCGLGFFSAALAVHSLSPLCSCRYSKWPSRYCSRIQAGDNCARVCACVCGYNCINMHPENESVVSEN